MNKQIIENAKNATQALETHQGQFEMLKEKLKEIEGKVPGLKEATLKAEADKQKALGDFCLDKCDQGFVDVSQDISEKAQNAENRAVELLKVVANKGN
jgi:hypothetical protein